MVIGQTYHLRSKRNIYVFQNLIHTNFVLTIANTMKNNSLNMCKPSLVIFHLKDLINSRGVREEQAAVGRGAGGDVTAVRRRGRSHRQDHHRAARPLQDQLPDLVS